MSTPTAWPVRLDRRNRTIATVLALLLVAAGAYGLARSLGALGEDEAASPVLGDALRRSVVDNAGLVGGAAMFAALVVAWLGWRWLRLQLLPSPTLNEMDLAGSDGRTTLEASAVAVAVTRDLESGPGVASGRARLVGRPEAPALEVEAELDAGADPAAVRDHVDGYVVPRARAALDRPDLTAAVRLRLGDPRARALD